MKRSSFTIEPQTDTNSKTWLLPKRDSSAVKSFGWSAIGLGSLITLFITAWATGLASLSWFFAAKHPLFAIMPLAMLLVGFTTTKRMVQQVLFAFKLLRNQSQCEVKIEGDKLVATEKLGRLDAKVWMPIKSVTSFNVEQMKPQDCFPTSLALDFGSQVHVLVAGYEGGRTVTLAAGYPKDQLLQLATRLAQETGLADTSDVQAEQDSATEAEDQPKPAQADRSQRFVATPIVRQQPADSKIVVHERGDSVAYEIPPVGLNARARASLIFKAVWTGFFLLPLSGAIAAGQWFIAIWVIPFLLVGLVMLGKLIQSIYRRTTIGVKDDLLFVETKSILQDDWLEIHRDDVRAFVLGDEELAKRGSSAKELHLLRRDGKRERLLGLLSSKELDWMAFNLSHDLGLQFGAEKLDWKKELVSSAPERKQALDKSGVDVEHSGDGKSVYVPSRWKDDKVNWFVAAAYLAGLNVFFFWVLGMSSLFESSGGIVITAAVLLVKLERYTQSFRFVTSREGLKLLRQSIFMKKQFNWSKEQLKSITVETEAEVPQDSSVYFLSIESADGSLSILNGRPKQRLAAIAGTLSESLALERPDFDEGSAVNDGAAPLTVET